MKKDSNNSITKRSEQVSAAKVSLEIKKRALNHLAVNVVGNPERVKEFIANKNVNSG